MHTVVLPSRESQVAREDAHRRETVRVPLRGLHEKVQQHERPCQAHEDAHHEETVRLPIPRLRKELHGPQLDAKAHQVHSQEARGGRGAGERISSPLKRSALASRQEERQLRIDIRIEHESKRTKHGFDEVHSPPPEHTKCSRHQSLDQRTAVAGTSLDCRKLSQSKRRNWCGNVERKPSSSNATHTGPPRSIAGGISNYPRAVPELFTRRRGRSNLAALLPWWGPWSPPSTAAATAAGHVVAAPNDDNRSRKHRNQWPRSGGSFVAQRCCHRKTTPATEQRGKAAAGSPTSPGPATSLKQWPARATISAACHCQRGGKVEAPDSSPSAAVASVAKSAAARTATGGSATDEASARHGEEGSGGSSQVSDGGECQTGRTSFTNGSHELR